MIVGDSRGAWRSVFPFQNVFYYFSVFRNYIGKRLYIVFGLTTLASLADGLGITLLLPLLAAIGSEGGAGSGELGMLGGGGDASGLEVALQGLLATFGIQDSIAGILLFMALVFFLKGVIKFVEGAYHSHLQAQFMLEVRGKLFDAYSTMDYRYYGRHNTGHFVNLLNEQIHSLVLAFSKYKQFLATLIAVIAYFVFAMLLSWIFASMALLAGIFVLAVFRTLSHYVQRLSRQTAEEMGSLNHFVVQTMQAFKYIAATAEVGPLREAVVRSIRRLASYFRKRGIANAFTDAVREPLSVAVLVTIIILQVLVLDQPLAPILVAVVLIYKAMGQILGLQSTWQATMSQIGSLEVVELEFERVGANQEVSGSTALEPLTRGIELRGVTFAYNAADGNVVEDVTLSIPANQSVALVGESGAGKSTLVDILTLLLRPDHGELTIDGIPHEAVDLGSWREQIGFVSQETVVFDDTVANNICLWRGDYDADPEVRRKVEEAAERAYARRFIDELPEGFNTRVGDRGVRLSGGQRQRLFIARELYKNPRLLILDEATSALDSESESVIQASVDELRGSTTVVMIAHRLSTIKNADHIYVLDRGRVIQQGSYDDLISSEEGPFKRMVSLQML